MPGRSLVEVEGYRLSIILGQIGQPTGRKLESETARGGRAIIRSRDVFLCVQRVRMLHVRAVRRIGALYFRPTCIDSDMVSESAVGQDVGSIKYACLALLVLIATDLRGLTATEKLCRGPYSAYSAKSASEQRLAERADFIPGGWCDCNTRLGAAFSPATPKTGSATRAPAGQCVSDATPPRFSIRHHRLKAALPLFAGGLVGW